ncbi:MAG: hypothetical protein CVU56_23590 [Deltaproteobacteria bacterium HGW-Deltaproteobacteria-14]|jgi:hypothetical protein|nr:MAG: hypothetical protein CVU56_23590 [Deltaproteobacteria bacterium HGW-Deltaproteobacteria-14]
MNHEQPKVSARVARVVFATRDGRAVAVEPGHFIGRSAAAALRLREPGVSEAHALVSLRGSSLRLLALRGRFLVDGVLETEVELEEGQEITLAHGVVLTVDEVSLPSRVLGLCGDDLPRQILPPIASLTTADGTRVTAGFVADHDALIWSDGERFYLRREGLEELEATPGLVFEVGARRFTFVSVPLEDSATPLTAQDDSCDTPLVIVARYDSVHVTQGHTQVIVTGLPARVLSELAVMQVPAEWDVVARELWPDDADPHSLRQKWDRTLSRLRRQLRTAGLRPDLLRSDGCGRVELILRTADQVIDET